jgi:phosphoglycerol transferase
MRQRTLRALAEYGGAGGLSLLAALALLRLATADLRVPFDYQGDALFFAMLVKSVIDTGWYLTNPLLGAPGGLELHDFPMADSFHLFLVKIFGVFSSDWALLFNLSFLLGFPLITMSALAVFRHFRVPYGAALVGSLLFAFLPSRLIKGQGHLFLDSFFEVPLALMVLLWVCSEEPPLIRAGGAAGWGALDLRRRRSWVAILICAFTAATGLYYAFFVGCLLVAGGMWASMRRRTFRNLAAALALTGVIVAVLAAHGLPTWVYRLRHGPNLEAAHREPYGAEIHAMKITQLLLPVEGHRVEPLRRLTAVYNAQAPLTNENAFTSLGVVGGIGFLFLLVVQLLGPRGDRPREELFRPLAALNLMAVLLATVGGFGSLFALLVTPQIRTYSRMNVIIAFLALFSVVLLLERLGRWRPRLGAAVLPLVLGVGLLDQATVRAVRRYSTVAQAYREDADLVRQIAATVPSGGMIFQLPFIRFPEQGPVHQLGDYEQVRPYLHTSARSHPLRWSYPMMRGRAGDAWASVVAERTTAELVTTLSDGGFEGILVHRSGYSDAAAAETIAALRALLEVEPLVGADGKLLFFSLAAHRRRTEASLSPDERERRREIALHPLGFRWGRGCHGLETNADMRFRWCGARGELRVENGARVHRRVSLKMRVVAAHPPARVIIEGNLVSASLDVAAGGASLSRIIEIPPGNHLIRFGSDGKPAMAPTDPRTLVWRAEDFVVQEVIEHRE